MSILPFETAMTTSCIRLQNKLVRQYYKVKKINKKKNQAKYKLLKKRNCRPFSTALALRLALIYLLNTEGNVQSARSLIGVTNRVFAKVQYRLILKSAKLSPNNICEAWTQTQISGCLALYVHHVSLYSTASFVTCKLMVLFMPLQLRGFSMFESWFLFFYLFIFLTKTVVMQW